LEVLGLRPGKHLAALWEQAERRLEQKELSREVETAVLTIVRRYHEGLSPAKGS
jgi:hypothetical protein